MELAVQASSESRVALEVTLTCLPAVLLVALSRRTALRLLGAALLALLALSHIYGWRSHNVDYPGLWPHLIMSTLLLTIAADFARGGAVLIRASHWSLPLIGVFALLLLGAGQCARGICYRFHEMAHLVVYFLICSLLLSVAADVLARTHGSPDARERLQRARELHDPVCVGAVGAYRNHPAPLALLEPRLTRGLRRGVTKSPFCC